MLGIRIEVLEGGVKHLPTESDILAEVARRRAGGARTFSCATLSTEEGKEVLECEIREIQQRYQSYIIVMYIESVVPCMDY